MVGLEELKSFSWTKRLSSAHAKGTCRSDMWQRQFSLRDMPVFAKTFLFWDNIVPTTCSMKFSWFQLVRYEAGTKWPQFSMSHHVHSFCKLSPLQHIFMPRSVSCAPTCVLFPQHASYAINTWRGLSPLHEPATGPLVYLTLKWHTAVRTKLISI